MPNVQEVKKLEASRVTEQEKKKLSGRLCTLSGEKPAQNDSSDVSIINV